MQQKLIWFAGHRCGLWLTSKFTELNESQSKSVFVLFVQTITVWHVNCPYSLLNCFITQFKIECRSCRHSVTQKKIWLIWKHQCPNENYLNMHYFDCTKFFMISNKKREKNIPRCCKKRSIMWNISEKNVYTFG